jgi:carboxypeptidase C (cathepsin A)
VSRRHTPLVLCFLCLAVPASGAHAEDRPNPPKAEKADPAHDTLSETSHSLLVNGTKLEFRATAGTLPLRGDDGKVTAHVFFVSYTRLGGEAAARRPITFVFNGGPGASSVWLHLGALGPRRVDLGDQGEAPTPPYRLVDNQDTLLDVTDLVFIDPVTTGFSRAAEGVDAKRFHGFEPDVESVGEFIRLYLTRFRRWESPKFLLGESYGTTRAAALAGYLQDRHGINLNGVILLSSVLNFEALRFDEGNDLPYVLFLPGYTAAAWYHKRLPADLQADRQRALAEAEKFAGGEYAHALLEGDRLSAEDARQVKQKLARLTGLSEDFVARNNLRVDQQRFAKELLRSEGRVVGRFDARLAGPDADAAADHPEYDPSYAAVQGAFTAAFNQYVRAELKYETDTTYEVLTGRVMPWDYGNAKNRYLNVSPTLRNAMTRNRALRLFIGNGLYDLATPYPGAAYTSSHLGLERALADHVTLAYYDAGHMMYTHKPSRQKLKKDLAAFYRAALGGEAGQAVGEGR